MSTIATTSPNHAISPINSGPLTAGGHSYSGQGKSSTFIGRGNTKGPAFLLSPENRFLAACASPRLSPEAVQQLLRPGLDWQLIIDGATDNGLAPLVYFHLKNSQQDSQVPPRIVQQLRLRFRESAVTAMRQSEKLQEILVALRCRNIPVIVMKGAALGEMFYEVAGLRPMLDIDLMVRSSDLDAAACVLADLGYGTDESYQEAEWYRNHHHHLAPFVASDRSVTVELHHEVASPQANLAIDVDRLWERARSAQIASVPVLVLAPEDMLLGICTHVAISKRFVKSLRDLADIGAIINANRNDIDWDELVRNALAWRAGRCLYYCLWAAQSLVGADVPMEVLKKLRQEISFELGENACLKFLIPRAIFPDSTRIKPWLINDLIGEILCPRTGVLRTLEKRLLDYFGFGGLRETVVCN